MSFVSQIKTTLDAMYFLPDRHALPAVYTVAALILLIPLTVIDIPMIADYPNHVARMHILGNISSETLLSEHYAVDFDFIPNLAMDLVVPSLSALVSLDVAGRLFLALTVLSTLASVAFLHKTLFNRWSFTPLMALLVIYHGSLMAGMVNFSLGIGLVPAALASWIILQHASAFRRILVGSAVAAGLFFCHLVAFAAYGLLIIAYEGLLLWRERKRAGGIGRMVQAVMISGMTGLLPTLLFARQLLQHKPAASPDQTVAWGTLSWKIKAFLAPVANYNLGVDLASLSLLIALTLWSWRSGQLKTDHRMVPGLCLLAFGFLIAPKALWSGGVFDQRLAILFFLIFIASVDFRIDDLTVRRAVFASLTALVVVRMGLLTATWLEHRHDLAEMHSAVRRIEPGSRLLVVQPDNTAGPRLAPDRHMAFHHAAHMASLATLAVIEKSAFVSSIYAIPGQQPLRLRDPVQFLGGSGAALVPSLADLAIAVGENGGDIPQQVQNWRQDFDYVMLIYGYGQGAETLRGALPLTTLMDGDILDLYRIEREDEAGG